MIYLVGYLYILVLVVASTLDKFRDFCFQDELCSHINIRVYRYNFIFYALSKSTHVDWFEANWVSKRPFLELYLDVFSFSTTRAQNSNLYICIWWAKKLTSKNWNDR